MDRQFAFAGAIPQDTDVLSTNKNALYGLGYALQAALGTSTCVIGLAGAQTTVPSLQITIGPGAIHALSPVDATAYGDLGTDANSIVKQGILKAAQLLTLTAPTTSGYSQVYLVEAAYQDVDGGATVLPYYNSSNPSAPYAGPANAGTSNYTVRQGICAIALKAGTAAPTGTQTTPSTDPGYVPLYTITLVNGQTAITTAQIVTASGAPFVPYNLNNLPFYGAVTDTGAANAAVFATPNGFGAGDVILVTKISSANTSAMTINGATLTWADGTALAAGDWPASTPALVAKIGSVYFLLSVMGPTVFARLGVSGKAPGGFIGRRIFTTTGTSTYTPTAGTNSVVVTTVGGGGSGGGSPVMSASQWGAAGGGGSGGISCSKLTTGFSGVTMTIGIGGVGVAGLNGAAGGTTSFGALLSATGGAFGAIAIPSTIASMETGGNGGSGSGGNLFNSTGLSGMFGVAINTGCMVSGPGAPSPLGGGGGNSVYTSTSPGSPGTFYGAGGAGACGQNSGTAQPGGNGYQGCIIVDEYA